MSLSDVYRAAVALESEFGDDAHDIALERAKARLGQADHDGHRHWTQVAWALGEMRQRLPDRRH
ncbi:MAG: hypothetical protein ISS15_06740 [Alphaproteobacteria bacterium]|nr:hypothetical protein [Alphaproteobacteria bacterium]MBL7097334.1 hypothetical protein [Alphaproteobacteria bacterium]